MATPDPRARATKGKRPYLKQAHRRRRILEIAAQLVEREGWGALTMSALAEQGGTSRQLLYQHFPSLEKLIADTAWHIFTETMEGTRASIAAHPGNVVEAVAAAEAVTLDLSPGRGDALWQLMAGTAGASPELEHVRQGLRELISNVWTPLVRRELGLAEADAKAYAWMMVMAFWGMRQLVRDGAMPRARGIKLFNEMVGRVVRR